MIHEHRVVVRYGETDQMGVVYHANYLLYMEEARTNFLDAIGQDYAALERSGLGLTVRKVELRYRSPARYREELKVLTTLSRVGGASVRFDYAISLAATGAPLASGMTELACVDIGGPQPVVRLLPEDLRALLERAAEPQAGRSSSSNGESDRPPSR